MFQKWMKRVTVFVLKMQPLSVSSRMTIPAKDETLTATVITMVCMCTHKKTRTHVYVHVHVHVNYIHVHVHVYIYSKAHVSRIHSYMYIVCIHKRT